MSWKLTDGKRIFVTIEDDCPEELAIFIMDNVYEFLVDADNSVCCEVDYDDV